MCELELEVVRHALGVARKHGFAEVELALGEDTFSAALAAEPVRASKGGTSESASPNASNPPDVELPAIRATLVGYYREAPNALRAGRSVRKGDIVAVIEALGLANDVESTVSGEIVEVFIEPGQAVQYGQNLAFVRPL